MSCVIGRTPDHKKPRRLEPTLICEKPQVSGGTQKVSCDAGHGVEGPRSGEKHLQLQQELVLPS